LQALSQNDWESKDFLLHLETKCSMLTPAVTEKSSQFAHLDTLPLSALPGQTTLFGLDSTALAALMESIGEPAWRGRQLAEALYRQRITELDAITTLPKALRERLRGAGWAIGRPRIAQLFRSADGTERYLVDGGDGLTVETVWMPEGDEGETGDGSDLDAGDLEPGGEMGTRWRRATICVSSQVGCDVNCRFCLTAKLGLQRNLSAGEIAGQVLAVFDRHSVEVGRERVNLVFMGMGEPFLNYTNFMAAIWLLVEEVGLSPQRMTVSTSGIVPGILRFAAESEHLRPKLAISLNAPNDTLRSEMMPINRKWPIAAVIDAVRQLQLRPRERVTFEYVLVAGVNDLPEDAREVARLVRRSGLPAKVNLIAWNPGLQPSAQSSRAGDPGPGADYATPCAEAVEAFRRTLVEAGVPAYLRKPRGRDIYAACGQLKRTVEG
jgi:23S rRNA (adenine2503-C2)-methyltransferase